MLTKHHSLAIREKSPVNSSNNIKKKMNKDLINVRVIIIHLSFVVFHLGSDQWPFGKQEEQIKNECTEIK